MRKIMLISIGTLVFAGCTDTTAGLQRNSESQLNEIEAEYVNAYEEIDAESMMDGVSYAEISYNPGNHNLMQEMAADIVLAKVLSIDGGSNYNYILGEYCYPYTYGKLQILDSYKGSLSSGDEISYMRIGGIITYEEYYEGLLPAQKEKRDQFEKEYDYVKEMFER